MNNVYNPPRFGEKRENEVSCWAFGIPVCTPDRKFAAFLKKVSNFAGFVGVRPEYPHGTLLIFRTENDAKRARNRVESKGMPVGGIAECYIPKEYVCGAKMGKGEKNEA